MALTQSEVKEAMWQIEIDYLAKMRSLGETVCKCGCKFNKHFFDDRDFMCSLCEQTCHSISHAEEA